METTGRLVPVHQTSQLTGLTFANQEYTRPRHGCKSCYHDSFLRLVSANRHDNAQSLPEAYQVWVYVWEDNFPVTILFHWKAMWSKLIITAEPREHGES